ncbi:retinoblastoma-related protein-like isoform X2 [Tasmannia lanceolata]|uniref:retinoblastoma-related protein-like isoform X2 n=1 Tax=Tasmannia lanceolata TaxID=3420 RepID=UPI004062A906
MSPANMDMEDVKPVISSINSHLDVSVLESRFSDLCKSELSLDENMLREAMTLLKESKNLILANNSGIGCGTSEEIERALFTFVLYTVKKLNASGEVKQENEDNGFTLCQILRVTRLSVVEFFKEMPQFFVKTGHILSKLYGVDWEKRLEVKELKANFVHLSLLSKFYKRAYLEFFLTPDVSDDKHTALSSNTGYVSGYHRFGWLLFLALRIHAFSRFKDLVTCTNGLVSILAILILHVPVRLRNFSLCDSPLFVRKCNKDVDLIASLCKIYHSSEEELRRTMEKANNLIVDILKKKPCPASECKTGNLNNITTDGLTYFEGLMIGESLSSSLLILENDYDDAIHNMGELDERMFVDGEESLLGTGSLSGGAMNISGTKRKFDAMASPTKTITSCRSPPRTPSVKPANGSIIGNNLTMAQTPVSTAMTTAKWLRTFISPLPSKPSAELERFLSSCDRDVNGDITRRANIILEAIFPNSSLGERCVGGSMKCANLMDSIWEEQRRMEALKLYYRVLEAMCRAELRILQDSNLTPLLTNESFHRCMLACSAELVLATHKTVTMLFPAVLERTGITAFDLSKVIESFVRHEETLPRELKRHLNSLEERLLESMAWEKGSSMYNCLIVAKPTLASEINRLGLLAEPMPSLDAIAMQHNVSTGGLPPLPPLLKHEISLDRNGDARSPKRVYGDCRSVLAERNSFASPMKDRLLPVSSLKSKLPPPLQSAFASPTRPNPAGGGETCAETGIRVFFCKIVKLAAIRIRSLCERLQLSQQVLENIYCLIQQILSQQTALFFNRHIDQLILCSFYGVAKISKLSLTFKEIVHNYRNQPQCKPQVFRGVFVGWPSTSRNGKTGQMHVDIITFYNDIFIPAVKPLLEELGPAGATLKTNGVPEDNNNADGSPRLSPFPSLPDMSPKKVSAARNVYVSPLRSSKMNALNSHGSKSYYACVGESTHAYQSPSKDLTAINNRLNSNRKVSGKLNFDDVGLVSDSLVAGSLYPQNGTSTSNAPLKCEQADP